MEKDSQSVRGDVYDPSSASSTPDQCFHLQFKRGHFNYSAIHLLLGVVSLIAYFSADYKYLAGFLLLWEPDKSQHQVNALDYCAGKNRVISGFRVQRLRNCYGSTLS